MAKTWEKWFDEVLPDVPGCPQPVAKNAIRNAAIEFFERSWAYRVDHAAIDALAAIGSYAYVPPAGYKVAMPVLVWFNKLSLAPKSAGQLVELYAHWPSQTGTRPLYYLQEALEKLIVVPAPDAALVGAITLKVALKPTRASADIDDTLFEKYLEEIAHGAKGKLFAMKKKPWSDPGLAGSYLQMFDTDIAKAKLAADRGFVRATPRTRARFF